MITTISIFLSILLLYLFIYKSSVNKLLNFKKIKHLLWSNKLTFIFLLFLILFFASISSDYVIDYDSYLYHLQSIHWLEKDPLVVGLANLHQRLAFSSIWFNLHALFGFSKIFGYPLAIYNGLSIIFLSTVLILGSIKVKQISSKLSFFTLPILLILLSASEPMYRILRGYSPDIPTMVFTILWFYIALQNTKTFKWIFKLLLISLVTIGIKLSGLPLLIFTILLFIQNRSQVKVSKRQINITVALTFTFFSLFFITNTMKSGYLIYPVSITKLPVYWAESSESVKHLEGIISSWAKTNTINTDYFTITNLKWVPIWIAKKSISELTLLIVSVLALFTSSCISIFKKKKHLTTMNLFLLLLFLYWFLIAPDIRFGYGVLFSSIFIGLESIKIKKIKSKFIYFMYSILFLTFLFTNLSIKNYLYWFRVTPLLVPKGLQEFSTQRVELNGYTYYKATGNNDRTGYTDFPSTNNLNPCLKQDKKGIFTIFYVRCD